LKRYLVAMATMAAATAAFAQVDPARTVMVVNGEEIKGSEYYHRMEYLPGIGQRQGNNYVEFPPGFFTITQLVTEHLLFQLAKQKGVYPTDTEVANDLADRVKDDPNYLVNWKASGQNEDDLRRQIRFELARFKLTTFGITVTDQEVQKYYNANPEMFTTPKQYKLTVIAVTTAGNKDAVDADLKAGKNFTDVAKARSEDLTKGEITGPVPVTGFNRPIQDALTNVKIGGVTTWITSGTEDQPTFVKIRVEDILPEKKSDFTPDLKEGIRRKMMLERGSVKNNLTADMNDMRRKAKIDIKQKEFGDIYRKYIETYLSQTAPGS